jgi:ubiquinone/menaquinone biosynthesis C-methylase UbiE
MLKTSDFFGELKLRRDSHVADFGCSVGENAKILSELVIDGKVFAVDVHKDLLEHIENDILKEKKKQEKANLEHKDGHVVDNILYQNIVPVWGDFEELEGTRLRDDSIDAILISNTFFLLQHKKVCVMEMKRVLKKYGKILFIDWHTHLGKSYTHKESILSQDQIVNLFEEFGFIVYPRIHTDNHHFVLLIEKR